MAKGVIINVQLQQLAKHMHIPSFIRTILLIEGVYRNESDTVNLDNADGPGTYWVAYVKRGYRAVCFDNFGNLRALSAIFRRNTNRV